MHQNLQCVEAFTASSAWRVTLPGLQLTPTLESDRHPIRHLLIGTPDVVNLTIHRLHNLGYAEAILWSPAIALANETLTLTLNPGEVMRVLVRSVRLNE